LSSLSSPTCIPSSLPLPPFFLRNTMKGVPSLFKLRRSVFPPLGPFSYSRALPRPWSYHPFLFHTNSLETRPSDKQPTISLLVIFSFLLAALVIFLPQQKWVPFLSGPVPCPASFSLTTISYSVPVSRGKVAILRLIIRLPILPRTPRSTPQLTFPFFPTLPLFYCRFLPLLFPSFPLCRNMFFFCLPCKKKAKFFLIPVDETFSGPLCP